MKYLLIGTLICTSVVFCFSCRKNINLHREIVSVQIHDCSTGIKDVSLCFDSLLTDSRCPVGADCVWAGSAVIKATFHAYGEQHSFRISTSRYPHPTVNSDTMINGYRIELLDVKPLPEINVPYDTANALAIFSVTQ